MTSLERLEEISPLIYAATDKAVATVREVEKRLKSLDIGIRATTMKEPLIIAEASVPCLSFRHGRIMAHSYPFDGPFLEAPREVKLATFPYLGELLEKMASNAEILVGSVDEAIKKVNETADRVIGSPKLDRQLLG